jgi:hypothetical protein
MTDPGPEEIAFQADLDRLRAHFGAARLEDEDKRFRESTGD